MAGFWLATLPIHFKSTVSNAVVTTALMAGLEAEVLHKSQLEEIEKTHMILMRKASGSLCPYDSTGIRKQLSNEYIRELMGINHPSRESGTKKYPPTKKIINNSGLLFSAG